MAISHSGYSFPASMIHGLLVSEPADAGIQVHTVNGITSEGHLLDNIKGRFVSCDVILKGYSTAATLQDIRDTFDQKKHQLTGTVTVTGTFADTFSKMTFLGFQPEGPPFYDAITSKFGQRGRLIWRQRQV